MLELRMAKDWTQMKYSPKFELVTWKPYSTRKSLNKRAERVLATGPRTELRSRNRSCINEPWDFHQKPRKRDGVQISLHAPNEFWHLDQEHCYGRGRYIDAPWALHQKPRKFILHFVFTKGEGIAHED
jgi:hypothetical protein